MGKIVKAGPSQLLRQAQDRIERIGHEPQQLEVVQQSPVWLRATIWTLLATAGFSVAWLALAQTEEIVVANGKLEPIGDVKEIQVPWVA